MPDGGWGLLDYAAEAASVEVAVGSDRNFELLGGDEGATLRAWCRALIAPGPARPGADEIGAAEYIDATCLGARALADPLRRGLAELERLAWAGAGRSFRACASEEQQRLLADLEAAEPELFAMVRDFTYEAYYAHPTVLAALEAATGWRGKAPSTGTAMRPFDQRRLERVRSLPPFYRRVAEGRERP